MNTRIVSCGIAAVCIAGAIGARAQGVSRNGPGWTANGASACQKYLTPDVVAAILPQPAGPAQRIDATSCQTGNVSIYLKVADVDAFRQELRRIVGAHPIAGIGDAAYWNEAGALSAVKGHDRGCDISDIAALGTAKISDEALAKKLGVICNKLFALP